MTANNESPIRKAATLLVARPANDGVELFMVRRPARGAFPNLRVFPGGKVDDADGGFAPLCQGLADAAASSALGVVAGGLRYWVTAIRECFEECGVLFAYRRGTLFRPEGAAEAERFDSYRQALAAGDLSLRALLESEGLRLATDRVFYFSHWITPPTAPARFDTRFFLGLLPAGQCASRHSAETIAGEWVTPANALARHKAGRWEMIHPTLTTLRTVVRYQELEALFADVRARRHLGEVGPGLREQGQQPAPRR